MKTLSYHPPRWYTHFPGTHFQGICWLSEGSVAGQEERFMFEKNVLGVLRKGFHSLILVTCTPMVLGIFAASPVLVVGPARAGDVSKSVEKTESFDKDP